MGPNLPAGLDWCVAGLLAAAVALVAGPVQALVLGWRAPAGERGARLRAALVGPAAAFAIGVIGGLAVDLFALDTKRALDRIWPVLPIAALAAWFAINRALIRKLPGAAPQKAEAEPTVPQKQKDRR